MDCSSKRARFAQLAFCTIIALILQGLVLPRLSSTADDATSADPTRPPFAPNASCVKVFVVPRTTAGLGHRMLAFAIAVSLALRSDAAIMLGAGFFTAHRASPSGDGQYPFVHAMFSLGRFNASAPDAWPSLENHSHGGGSVLETPWGALSIDPAPEKTPDALAAAQRAMADPRSCGHAYFVPTGWEHGCGSDAAWCFFSHRLVDAALPPPLVTARPIMRALYHEGQRPPLVEFAAAYAEDPRPLVVAWHVRNGDLRLADDEAAFREAWGALRRGLAAAGGVPARHFVISERPVGGGAGGGAGGGFAFLSAPDLRLAFPSPPLATSFALAHLAAADVLVDLGGSSFAILAALVAPPTQVRLAGPPKEVRLAAAGGGAAARDVLSLGGPPSFDLDASGALRRADEAALAGALRARHALVAQRGA